MALGLFRGSRRARQRQCSRNATAVQLAGPAVPDLVETWTGWHADSLRQALRMTNESFAEHLRRAVRTVAYWRERPDMIPRPMMQGLLDTALARAPQLAQDHFWVLEAGCGPSRWQSGAAARLLASEDVVSLTEWLTATSVSDETIESLDRASARVAESHGLSAPAVVLAEARQVQASVQGLLRAGRVRHRQE